MRPHGALAAAKFVIGDINERLDHRCIAVKLVGIAGVKRVLGRRVQ
jgi:hypothetical protein